MKKFVLIVSFIYLMTFAIAAPVFAEEENNDNSNESLDLASDAESAILIERDTGKLIFDKNAHEKLPPASMTKVMTLLLIMEALDQGDLELDEVIQISEYAASMGGSQVFLEAGEEMSVEDLLKGVAIASGNDASVALAERIAGSEEAFVQKMNDKVETLELENTKFQNTTGLPADDHYSTSYDMAIIAKELLKYETITDYTSVYEDYLREGEEDEFWLVNTNRLVRFYSGVDGLKTGFTNEAKYCLTATAQKDDMRVVAVVMGVETPKERNATVSEMLDYAFNHFDTKKLFDKDEIITTMQLLKAENKDIDVVASQSISTIHAKGESTENLQTIVNVEEDVTLPLKKGDQVGTLIVENENDTLSETPLVVDRGIEKASYFTFIKRSMQEMAKYR
ncbi:D-alanyl-D-alanine carboxypeptidase (penicillin-binding protein 5/6) [Virgibacillus natechei]|uniref:serine-type D-Ala-D-Ala carboxypeptidase n=1 Tax=Virgibacillus natechei TaxID=1216297 RepID=A0ABS4IFG0_9BACI|nr:D-alanyl-D-alanine carboxypeptidase family protein [Virgibacillus natechei]MBP1969663.1 D-alanyl-D-alanine carboxypeptidase (penicillin-binding protein 5/6) [Virgibacillus natechei]UZD11390.1 D-alanyl-D-alanine carboxypeptidase [Virgibacillus natechei]